MFHLFGFFIMMVALYFLPSIIGWQKQNATAIVAVNVLLGWTVVGWIVALIWALSSPGATPFGNWQAPWTPQPVPPQPAPPPPQPPPAGPSARAGFCSHCGSALRAGDKFCAGCGNAAPVS